MYPAKFFKFAVLAAACLLVGAGGVAHAQLLNLSLQGDGRSLVPQASFSINGPGFAAGVDGSLGYSGGTFQDSSTLATGNAWAALVYKDLDRVQLGVSAASHPSLLSPASYLRSSYNEIAFEATGYPLTISRDHADRPASVLGFVGATVAFDQRNYHNVDPGLEVDRVLSLGLNLFGMVVASPKGELPMYLNILNNKLAFELAGNNPLHTAFRYTLTPIAIDNLQLTKPNSASGLALYLDASAGVYVYKPPIYNTAFDFSVQFGLGGDAEIHLTNETSSFGLGLWRAPDLGITASTSGLEDRMYFAASHAFSDSITASATAFLGVLHQHEGSSTATYDVSTRGVAADVGYGVLDWLSVGVRGDYGQSPYFQVDRSDTSQTLAVSGYDLGLYARASWSHGQGASTGLPGVH